MIGASNWLDSLIVGDSWWPYNSPSVFFKLDFPLTVHGGVSLTVKTSMRDTHTHWKYEQTLPIYDWFLTKLLTPK